MTSVSPKNSLQLYRDCLRLIRHVAGNSPKADHLRLIVSSQFRKNKDLVDAQAIHEAKQAAERVLSNYFLFEHLQKDPKLQSAREKSWAQTEVADANYLKSLEGLLGGDGAATSASASDSDAGASKPLP